MSFTEKLKDKFTTLFQADPLIVRSPGRVNLIGEHTDYNNGLVLPAAIDKHITLAIGKRTDGEIHLHSLDNEDNYVSAVSGIKESGKLWPDYILGVADQLLKRGYTFSGFNLAFGGNIPQGAGLSSSAALECATVVALSELFGLRIAPLDAALIAQAAENDFVGVKCGLMDQFASVFGKDNHLIKLDCADYSYEYIPFSAKDINIVLFDTQVKHSLASSAYNERREQCEKGVSLVRQHHPQVNSLRDVTEEQLLQHVRPVDELIYRRCHYVVSEIRRLQEACEDLKRDDFNAFGSKMFETHDGLQHLYEVSCRELDILVELVKPIPHVLGARMMGGGFGGCTINLVKAAHTDEVVAVVKAGYERETGQEAGVYIANISSGTRVL